MSSSQTAAGTGLAKPRFDYLPIGLFGAVMGMTGLAVAWRLAHARYGVPLLISNTLAVIAVATFLLILGGYAAKAIVAADAVRAEFHHPIAGNLFGTLLISILLLPIVIAPVSPMTARVMWGIGAPLMLGFAWMIVSRWMSDRQQVAHATPAWIIPVVGLLDIPLAVPSLGLPPYGLVPLHGLMLFALSVGLFFAVPLFTLIFSRLLFEPPLPDALKPSLLILLAPFAVGYSTYLATVGHSDLFADALYMLMLFVLSVLLGQLRTLPICCPFRVGWWAVSFPLAAASIAGLRFANIHPDWLANAIAITLLGLATLVITGLFVRSLLGVARGELRTLST